MVEQSTGEKPVVPVAAKMAAFPVNVMVCRRQESERPVSCVRVMVMLSAILNVAFSPVAVRT